MAGNSPLIGARGAVCSFWQSNYEQIRMRSLPL